MQYTTTYRRASTVAMAAGLVQVFLAAMQRRQEEAPPKPWLFRGQLAEPLLFRDGLLTLRDVVTARFYRPDLWRLLDPVVTVEHDWVRLECFSSDAGVYTRMDLSPNTFHEGDLGSPGTTNVEFGADFAAQLSTLRPGKRSAFEVGEDSVTLATEAGAAVERQIELPERWLRGFLQVQAIQRAAGPAFALNRVQSRMLLSALPARAAGSTFISPLGALSTTCPRGASGFLEVSGLHRLRLLKRLAPHVLGLNIWSVGDGAPSFWGAAGGAARVTLALSSPIYVGFSGAGAARRPPRREPDETLLACARHITALGHRFTTAELARALDVPEGIAGEVVDLLSEQGLLGYDLPEGAFYRRDLPYAIRTGFVAQPRDLHSRRLLAQGKVEIERREPIEGGSQLRGWVEGDHATYRVQVSISPEGTILDGDCTCPWILQHGMGRGPCKHILALRLAGDDDERTA